MTDSGVKFTSVTEKARKVAIIGTGESLYGFDFRFKDDVTVITVNGAIELVPRVDFWFTLDLSARNRRILRNRRPDVTYYAAVPEDYGTPDARIQSMRAPPEEGVKYLHRISGDGHDNFKTKGGIPEDKSVIHTGNSGWGAFQLALHMGATRIALFGFDGVGLYVYGGRPRHLHMMPALFASALPYLQKHKIAVINGSPKSTIQCLNMTGVSEARQWLHLGK